MLIINYIKDNQEEVIKRLQKRNFDATSIINEIIKTDEQRKELQNKLELVQAETNSISKEIGELFKSGKAEEGNKMRQKTTQLKEDIKTFTQESNDIEITLKDLIVQVPNMPHDLVPEGKTPEDNVIVKTEGELPKLSDKALPHWELASKYDLIDFELGNKITGAGFPVYKGKGAKLQRALINFFLDEAEKAGYKEVIPPLMVNEDSAFGTGQLPDKEGQMYHVTEDNLYLIPTAEVPVTNIFRNNIYQSTDFPIKYTAYTPCFRREAGSYGKDVRGLNRLHQFDKVEIVQVTHPDNSYSTLDKMVSHVENLVNKLELPYRILKLCGGDMGFTAALTYDFEVYSSAQEKWLEVSSVSNFESYQANRLKLRFKEAGAKKTVLAHTLNGSALALPRIVASLLENNQSEKGIKIPKELVKYTGFEIID